MAMRRAAYAPDARRFRQAGAARGDRRGGVGQRSKVVMFSYFRDVLDTVAAVLGGVAIGPLTGSTPPITDRPWSTSSAPAGGPAVLVSQIQAGGVGLNLQAASVVILTEPQWNPTIEDQAIARCHRMGQVRSVDVHRLLAEYTVDQRMLEILAAKADPLRRVRPPQRAEGPEPKCSRRLRPEGGQRGGNPGRGRTPNHRNGTKAPSNGEPR